MLPSVNALRNLLVHATLVLTLAAAAFAQKSISVSSPTKDGTDIVTIRYKEAGSKETKSVTANVPLTKGTSAADKAVKVKEAINGSGDPKVSAAVDATKPNKVNVTGAAGVTIKSVNLSGASGERRDAAASMANVDCVFTTQCVGAQESFDGDGDPSTFTIGTARGEVEVTLLDYGSVEEAMYAALLQLQEFGIDAWMQDDSTIAIFVDRELDQEAYFGCTDAGLVQISELSTSCDGCGD